MPKRFYITTPIYYVNDRPHIGHCYTTTLADAVARFRRLLGNQTFFLTGTDEHAEKVVTTAAERRVSPIQWADTNAAEFRAAFALMRCEYSDFIRTTEERHKSRVVAYIRELQASGDVFLGEYTGWWDPSQEEYLTETTAKEANYVSPVSGKPLAQRTEKNYFFRLSAYQDRLLEHIRAHPECIQPEARRNEVLGRLRDRLTDVPISRAVTSDPASQWGILMPDDPGHRIYVWIDALFNYLSTVDTDDRREFWPADVHVIAKDILWFHAVIWPCLLMALKRPLPRCVYAHAYWVREGRKMSKSLGNFVDLETLRAYADRFGVDALRWYLLTQGPLGATDADFSHSKFVEVYNADLANGFSNSVNRVGNMIEKYFAGTLPAPGKEHSIELGPDARTDRARAVSDSVAAATAALDRLAVDESLLAGRRLVTIVDQHINATEPFKLAKRLDEPGVRDKLADVLFTCAEVLRSASLLLFPAMPDSCAKLWRAWNCSPLNDPADADSGFKAGLTELAEFGGRFGLKPGGKISKGDPLFMRADPADSPPAAPVS
ncbi:MAG: methionine--tRNA ligase [Phycisphaeraceae bacterium]|nr:methionine--tRNA ligase [Phycisphaeraceae bacterium]